MRRVVLLLGVASNLIFANSFIDALKSGTKEGDINLIFDFNNAKPQKGEDDDFYKNNSYLVTSFGLYYQSAFYENFRLNLGFRGALPLYEGNRNSTYTYGKGDAARDFTTKAMIARSYLEYFDGDTSIKAGRVEAPNEILFYQFDGISIQNKTLGFMLIDFMWMNQYGNALDNQLVQFFPIMDKDGKLAKYGGSYYLGFTFEFIEYLKFKLYAMSAPDIYTFVGATVNVNVPYFSASTTFVQGFEHKLSHYANQLSYVFSIDLQANVDPFYAGLGYIKTSKDAGEGSLDIAGITLYPFLVDGYFVEKYRDVNLIYGKLGISIADMLSLDGIYGYRTLKKRSSNGTTDNTTYAGGEVDLYFNWQATENMNAILYYTNSHPFSNPSSDPIPNINRFGVMFKLSF